MLKIKDVEYEIIGYKLKTEQAESIPNIDGFGRVQFPPLAILELEIRRLPEKDLRFVLVYSGTLEDFNLLKHINLKTINSYIENYEEFSMYLYGMWDTSPKASIKFKLNEIQYVCITDEEIYKEALKMF